MKITKVGHLFQIQYRCPGYKDPIRERFETVEEAELRIAEVKLAKKRKNLKPPEKYLKSLNPSVITVKELLDRFIKVRGLNTWGDSTLSGHLTRIEHYILPYMGDRDITTITTMELDQFYDDLTRTPAVVQNGHTDTGKCVGLTVIEKIHSVLRLAFAQAVKWEMLTRNPAELATLPRHKKRQRDAWTTEEAIHALNVCDCQLLKLAMLVALGCSMRIGEILALTWSHIEITPELLEQDACVLHVDKELKRCEIRSLDQLREKGHYDIYFEFPSIKADPKTKLVLKPPKTDSSVRDIFIPKAVALALMEHKRQQDAWKASVSECYTDYDLVFAQESGSPVESKFMEEKLRDLIKEHGLREVVFHSLRHTSVSMKLSLCGDIKAVQGDTGHAQARMVTDTYAHIQNRDRQALAVSVNDSFFGQLNHEAEKGADPAETAKKVTASLSPEIGQIMKILMENEGMAQAMLGMMKCLS